MYRERVRQLLHQSTLVQQKERVFLLNLWKTSFVNVKQIATSITIVVLTTESHPLQVTLNIFLIIPVTRGITL